MASYDRTMSHPGRFLNALRARLTVLGNSRNWHGGQVDDLFARIRRPLDRRFLARVTRLGDHGKLGKAVRNSLAEQATPSRRVLICALRAWPDHNAYEIVIAQALRLRGIEVAIVTSGGGMPMCELGWPREAWPRPCDRCSWTTDRIAAASGLKHFRLADRYEWGENATKASLVPLPGTATDPAESARASTIWSLRTSEIASHEDGPEVLRDYAVAHSAVDRAINEILDEFKPESVLMVNGMFAAESAIRGSALARGLRAPTYEIAPRGGALVFSQEGLAPALDLDRTWELHGETPLTAAQSSALDDLLGRRTEGLGTHEAYAFEKAADINAIRDSLGLRPDSRIVSLFANITWDTALQNNDIVYGSMIEFAADAIRRVASMPDVDLVIRSHPAEVKWGTAQPVEPGVRSLIGNDIPPNVHFVRPDQTLNSYTLVTASDLVLSYATTVGLEAAVAGVPVAVAAQAHYRGRGFTVDLTSPDDLSEVMKNPPDGLTSQELELARRYAFAFFFRAMIPFPTVTRHLSAAVDAMVTSAAEIQPGADPYLDFICDRIIDGGHFDLPDELVNGAALVLAAQ